MMNAVKKKLKSDLSRVVSRLFSSKAGEMPKNKDYFAGLKSVQNELAIIGTIGAAIYGSSKMEIDTLKVSIKESEARMSNRLNKSEARTGIIVNQIKCDMKESEARMSNRLNESEARTCIIVNQIKSDMKESEARMSNRLNNSEERIKSDVRASEVRIFQKIDDALAGKIVPP